MYSKQTYSYFGNNSTAHIRVGCLTVLTWNLICVVDGHNRNCLLLKAEWDCSRSLLDTICIIFRGSFHSTFNPEVTGFVWCNRFGWCVNENLWFDFNAINNDKIWHNYEKPVRNFVFILFKCQTPFVLYCFDGNGTTMFDDFW